MPVPLILLVIVESRWLKHKNRLQSDLNGSYMERDNIVHQSLWPFANVVSSTNFRISLSVLYEEDL